MRRDRDIRSMRLVANSPKFEVCLNSSYFSLKVLIALFIEIPKKQWPTQKHWHPKHLICHLCHLLLNRIRIPWRNIPFQVCAENVPDEAAYLLISESEDTLKDEQVCVNRTQEQIWVTFTHKKWDNLHINEDSYCSVLKHIKCLNPWISNFIF